MLSKNFSLVELSKSAIATRYGLNNTPSGEAIANLKILTERILQPVRDHFQRPVIVTSGYRSLEINGLVGGSKSSQHIVGQAVDFSVLDINHLSVASWIRDALNFDQLILEFCDGKGSGWVHCSYSRTFNRKQTLTINQHGTFKGLQLPR